MDNIIHTLHKQIKEIAKSQDYLEWRQIKHLELLYPLQNLELEEWEELFEILPSLSQEEKQLVVDSIIEIKDNKKSNYDTSLIYAFVFTVSDNLMAECMLENFGFIDNGIPKRAELIDRLMDRLKRLEGKTKIVRYFSKEYFIINILYNISVY